MGPVKNKSEKSFPRAPKKSWKIRKVWKISKMSVWDLFETSFQIFWVSRDSCSSLGSQQLENLEGEDVRAELTWSEPEILENKQEK